MIISGIAQKKRRQHIKLTPFLLKFFAITTITKREHQAIKLTDHTQERARVRSYKSTPFCF